MDEKKPDFYQLIPIRLFEWEVDEKTQNVIVIRPKFTSKWGKKILLPLLGKQNFRIKLDPLGSIVWKHCDGEHTIRDILELLQTNFPDEEDLPKRLTMFIHQLVREKFIQLLQKVSKEASTPQG
jgi:hypothetical protein